MGGSSGCWWVREREGGEGSGCGCGGCGCGGSKGCEGAGSGLSGERWCSGGGWLWRGSSASRGGIVYHIDLSSRDGLSELGLEGAGVGVENEVRAEVRGHGLAFLPPGLLLLEGD